MRGRITMSAIAAIGVAVIGIAMAGLVAGPASAEKTGRRDALQQLSEALAFATVCPSVAVQRSKVETVSAEYGIEVSVETKDGRAILQGAMVQGRVMQAQPQKTVCADAIAKYGPKGSERAGLLARR